MPRSTGSCSTSAIGSAASRPSDPLVLCLAGWVEYPFSQTNYAAATAGVVLKPPVIERRRDDGTWQVIEPHAGYPAGLPRLMTLDLTGKLAGPSCVLRIKTNMECYYDQAFIAVRDRVADVVAPRGDFAGGPRRTGPSRLHPRGLAGRPATAAVRLRLHRSSPASLVRRQADPLRRRGRAAARRTTTGSAWSGRATRSGSSSTRNPCRALPEGWTRSYVLRSYGYCKDADPFTAPSDTVEPLPWRGMPAFPFGRDVKRPADPSYEAYLREYQTRLAGGGG